MKNRPLFVVAAGSGGHMLPALQWAQTWHTAHPKNPVLLLTGTSPLEQSIAQAHSYITEIKTCSIDTFVARKLWRYPKIALQVCIAIIKSFYYVVRYRPDHVISTGGLLTIPMAIAARITGCRVYVHELNVVPGKAVSFLLPWATKIFICFEKTKTYCSFLGKDFSYKCITKEYPVRFTLSDKRVPHTTIIATINHALVTGPYFEQARKTVVILGGSKGSVGLNALVKKYIIGHPERYASLQIIHQTGALDRAGWNEFYREKGIPALTFAFSDRIANYYALADLLVSRAGAGSLFEALFFEKPCIVVPLVASTTSHQVDNARELAHLHPHIFTLVDQETATRDQNIFDLAIQEKLKIC